MLTLFTWGYWGWGGSTRSTRKLVQAVDIAEKERKHKPSIFVDIRLQRSVRAKGFIGDAFADVVGAGRYKWMPELGNRSVATGRIRIEIDCPRYARELMQLAIECHRQKRRILFFCACLDLDTKKCHRHVVAKLLLREAARLGRRIEIVEWPGDKPTYNTRVKVKSSILKKVKAGRKSVPLGKNVDLKKFAGLPWGSPGKICGDAKRLKGWGVSFRKKKGLE
jgi:hypothetical protein